MAINARERESRQVCHLLSYLIPNLVEGATVSEDILRGRDEYYGYVEKLNEHTAMLCSLIGTMTEEHKNSVMYDGRKADARKLADWWEKHQEMDARRKEVEARKKEAEEVQQLREELDRKVALEREKIISMMSPEGRAKLGL